MTTTIQDVVENLNDSLGNTVAQGAQRKIYRAIESAYREFADATTWAYLQMHGRITTVAPYSTGTIAYTHSTRTVTLSGGTFPTWAAYAILNIGDVLYRVDSYTDSTHLVLDSNLNPGANVASGTSYTLFRDAYSLPADFRALGELQRPNFLPDLCYVPAARWQKERQVFLQTGTPTAYTVMGDPWNPGRLALFFAPAPDIADTYDFVYHRRPRSLSIRDESDGTVAVSNGGSTITGTGTGFTSAMIGSIFRMSGNSTSLPGGFSSDNPNVLEGRITAVASTTSMTIAATASASYSSVKFRISDPIDISDGAMLNAFLRCCEKHLAILGPKSLEERNYTEGAYMKALHLARDADARYVGPRFAGQKILWPQFQVGEDQS